MQKRSAHAFILILWLLAVCTLLSFRVEEIMTPQVQPTAIAMKNNTAPADVLFPEEDGAHLYAIGMRDGWEDGDMVYESTIMYYIPKEDKVIIPESGGISIARYATKRLSNREKIKQVRKSGPRVDDLYLAVYPGGLPEVAELPENMALLARTDTALLASEESAPTPFFHDRAQSLLFGPEAFYTIPEELAAGDAYSLTDVETFLSALPILAILPAMLLAVLILWGFSGTLLKDARGNRWPLLINFGLCLVTLPVVQLVLDAALLPSSLLPDHEIVDFAHYLRELELIFRELPALSGANAPQVAELLSLADALKVQLPLVLLAGVLFAALVVAAERLLLRRRKKLPAASD